MIKLSNKVQKRKDIDPVILFDILKKANDKSKEIIVHETSKYAEMTKDDKLNQLITKSRAKGEWFYLASSHNDCAKDHVDYQGKLYVDNKAPEEVIEYAKNRGLYTLQWVLGEPAWLITRPNCRHYFVTLTLKEVMGSTLKDLKNKHHTHTKEGDRTYQTPQKAALEEYEDRLKMLNELYKQYPLEAIKKAIIKTKLLIKKWKGEI